MTLTVPAIICPNCTKTFYLDAFTYYNYIGDVRCTNCGATLTVTILNGELKVTPINKTFEITSIPNAPSNVTSDVSEAQICHAVGAYKACVVMCRRSLEQVCDDKSAQGRLLHDKIHYLQGQGIISSEIFGIFEEIRYFGNYGAHPNDDLLGDVTKDDSSSVLEITLHTVKHIYDVPETIRRLRSRRGVS